VHISSLRRKLGGDERIKTIRSVGYQFVGIAKA
ncbi:MAG: winged helix-turn-helix domain-containing protein, partial [Deltaproteobacteria bacterium]|nr:winged helix-turn-helix domain-containing protein [Deltaproteobacteria bacterium]